MNNRIKILLISFIVTTWGCSGSYIVSDNVDILVIDGFGIRESDKTKEFETETLNLLFENKMVPASVDTVIVIKDHLNEFLLGCHDFAIFFNEQKQFYRYCWSYDNPSDYTVDTLDSFYEYNDIFIQSVIDEDYAKILNLLLEDPFIARYGNYDNEIVLGLHYDIITAYRIITMDNKVSVNVVNVVFSGVLYSGEQIY